MARHHIILLLKQYQAATGISSHIGFGIGSLLLCALAVFMCASGHSRRWRRWKASCYGYRDQDDPVIMQLNQFRDVDGGSDVDQGSSAVWKRNILMGGKCQLPDFSGVIIYDSTGNVATPPKNHPPPALPWK